MPFEFAITLPDSVAVKLREQGPDLAQLSLEILVCSLYHDGRLSQVETMRELNCQNRVAFEKLLAQHNLQRDWTSDEMEREFMALDRLRGPQ